VNRNKGGGFADLGKGKIFSNKGGKPSKKKSGLCEDLRVWKKRAGRKKGTVLIVLT